MHKIIALIMLYSKTHIRLILTSLHKNKSIRYYNNNRQITLNCEFNYCIVTVPISILHNLILRSATTFRYSPINELTRGLDRTTLAMHAVLSIDDQVSLSINRFTILIYASWAKSLFRTIIFGNGYLYII